MAKVIKAPTSEEVGVIKVKFLISPTGMYNLAYNPGEEASLLALQAEELIEAGYAEIVK